MPSPPEPMPDHVSPRSAADARSCRRRWLPLVVGCGLIAACAHLRTTPRPPWPSAIREYLIPDTLAFPNDIAVDRDGIVWYTDRLGSRIGRLDPESGEVRQYPTPTPASAPYGMTIGPEGDVWYAASRIGAVGRVDRETQTIREYRLPDGAGGPHDVVASKGRVWFTLRRSREYGWLDPRTGETKIFPLPLPGGFIYNEPGPYALAATPDGSVWFTAMGTAALHRIDPADGSLTSIALPQGGWPRRIATDAAGRVWYTNFPRSRIGMLDPRSRTVEELPLLGAPADPYGIAADPDGRIWFNEARNAVIVGYDPVANVVHTLTIPTAGATVRGMAVDAARRRVWLPLSGTHRIGRIDLP
jgi:virginiamycin B lyase